MGRDGEEEREGKRQGERSGHLLPSALGLPWLSTARAPAQKTLSKHSTTQGHYSVFFGAKQAHDFCLAECGGIQ